MDGLVRRCSENLLLSVTLCFIAGASTAPCLAHLTRQSFLFFTIPALLALPVLSLALKKALRPLTTLPFFFLVGLVHTCLALQPISSPNHLASVIIEPTKVTLIGRIQTMAEENGERTRFKLNCESLLRHDPGQQSDFQPIDGTVLLSVQGSVARQFSPGQKIMAMATVDSIRNYQTPGAFDYRLQMATQSVYCSGWVQSSQEIRPVGEPHRPQWRTLFYFPEQIRQQTAAFLNAGFPPEVAGLYQALLIGSMVNVPPRLMEAFKSNGCFHILSISGLHLSLLGLFSVSMFTFLLKRSTWLLLHTHVPTLSLVLTAPILFLYAFIAGCNMPAIRALVTALLVLFAVVVQRQRTLIHLIAAAALIVLVLSPLALFTASFQLSFAAVLAINLVYPRLPLFIIKQEGDAQRYNLPGKLLRIVQSMLYISLAATAGTLPILLYHFNRFSLIGPVMNLFIEPLLCLWTLPLGLLAIPLIPILPDLADILLHIGQTGIHLATWLTEAVSVFPYASIWTITPTFLEIILFYLILFLLLQPYHTRRQLALALGCAILLVSSFTLPLWFRGNKRELAISFLDVGQGTATLLQLPDGGTILIDGGSYQTEQFDPGQNLIAPFLWRKRIWRLDDLVVTHPHQDHYNGLPFIASHFHPHHLFVNGENGEEPAYGRFLGMVRQQGVQVQRVMAGDILRRDHDLTLRCMGMNGLLNDKDAWSINDRSLVLHLHYGAHNFLFPGDIGMASENRLVQHESNLQSAVILASHHGSRTSMCETFLAAVNPALIIVSASYRRQGTLPDQAHLHSWQQKKIGTLITAQAGTITCLSDGKRLWASTFRGDRYFYDEAKKEFVLE